MNIIEEFQKNYEERQLAKKRSRAGSIILWSILLILLIAVIIRTARMMH